ncbi:MAG: AraC family transcriptional regulator [Verrucomicrobiota bacterium]
MAHWPDGTTLFERNRTVTVEAAKVPRLATIARWMVRYIRQHRMQTGLALEQIPWTLDEYLNLQRLFQEWLRAYVDLMRGLRLRIQTHEPVEERVWVALRRMEAMGVNEPFREADLAHMMGVSKSHLNRLFVSSIGKTPADYWDERRMKAAYDALNSSRRSAKSIAYELGFSSLSHFSTWVRKKFGKSPRQLRREETPD